MRWFAEQFPQPSESVARDGRCDVTRRVPQVDGVNLGLGVGGQQAGTQPQDAAAVGGGAFGEDADDGLGVLGLEVFERDEVGRVGGGQGGLCEGEQDGAEERDALYFPGPRVGAREDGAEDAGEVERVQRAGEGARDDGSRVREMVFHAREVTVGVR